MKRFLIFTVTAGNGHNSAANAVKEELERQGAEVKVVDLLHEFCKNKAFIWVQAEGYGLACQYAHKLYNAFFRYYQKADPEKYYKSPVQSGIKQMYADVLKYINDFKPDAIFTSHFLPAVMITNLRKLYPLPAKTYSFVFDYAVCPFWEAATGIDHLLVPDESYIPYMESKGFKREQLLPYGLTVNEKFSKKFDKSEARKRLGLKDGVFTVLVMFGGGFWSGNYQIVNNIVKNIKGRELQIIVANGRDEKSKHKIDKIKPPSSIKILNFGFSREVDILMSAADIIVGKAGGVSVTESLNKFLPMVCCKELPEQEAVNVKMLVKEGAALQYKSDRHLIKILTELLNNPEKLVNMRKNVARIRRPHATRRVAEDMMQCSAVYEDCDIDYTKVNANIKRMLRKTKPASKVKKLQEKKAKKQAKRAAAKASA